MVTPSALTPVLVRGQLQHGSPRGTGSTSGEVSCHVRGTNEGEHVTVFFVWREYLDGMLAAFVTIGLRQFLPDGVTQDVSGSNGPRVTT